MWQIVIFEANFCNSDLIANFATRSHSHISIIMNNISFVQAVELFYKKYSDFEGRATRAEYWFPVLYALVVALVLTFFGKLGAYLSIAFSLVNLVPSIAVSIRRMHDIGKSGWWILIAFIPIIGSIWYLILCATPSKTDGNQSGYTFG